MRLRSKFLVVLLPVVLAGLTLQWVVSSYTQDRQMTGQRVALLSHILDNAALRMIEDRQRVLETYDLDEVRDYVDRYQSAVLDDLAQLADRADTLLIVRNHLGKVLLPEAEELHNDVPLPGIDKLTEKSFVHDFDGQPFLVVARSAEAWNWTVFAAYPLAAVKSAIQKVNLAITGSLILAGLCIALSLFVGVDRLVISPIRQLEHKLRALAAGCPLDHLRLAGADEIAELAAEMDAMAAGIAAYTAELERSNSELDSFAAAVGHDLRSPLRALKTIAGWVEADAGELPAMALAHLDQLREQIARMETMLQDLLHYAKASQVTGPLGACDVQELLSEQLELLSPKKAVELTVSGDPPVLITPEPPLALVLRNLIDNAIQHHDQPSVAIDIHLSRQGRRVVFRVSDDGPGIAPDERVRLFALLGNHDWRSRGTNSAGGCGIGLALVRRIVQRLGGSLELKSNATGRGTSVIFDWPLDCHMLPTLTSPTIRLPLSLVPAD